jgi:hypothetical protein
MIMGSTTPGARWYVKIPGAYGCNCNVVVALGDPLLETETGTDPLNGHSKGIWKRTSVGDTKNNGAGIPFTVTEVPASAVGSGTLLAPAVELARDVPNTLAIEPRAIAAP